MEFTFECRLDPKLAPDVIDYANKTVSPYSKISRHAWQLVNHHSFSNKQDMNRSLQSTHHCKERVANSAIADAQAKHDAMRETRKDDLERAETQIKKFQEDLEKLKTRYEELKNKSRANQLNEKELKEYQKLRDKRHDLLEGLDRARGRQKKYSKQLKEDRYPVCFGTKRVFRQQYHLNQSGFENHKEWKKAFVANRDKGIYYLGREEESFGNQMCQLSFDHDNIFNLQILHYDKDVRVTCTGQVRFTYMTGTLKALLDDHEPELKKARKADKTLEKAQSLSMRLVRKGEKWYLHVTLEFTGPEVTDTETNNGVVAIDHNAGFLSLAELDKSGNPVHLEDILTPSAGKNSTQSREEVDKASIYIARYAKEAGKPVVKEDLSFSKW